MDLFQGIDLGKTVLLVCLFWPFLGVAIIRNEIHENGARAEKMGKIKGAKNSITFFLKVLLYGPLTRSKLLDKL